MRGGARARASCARATTWRMRERAGRGAGRGRRRPPEVGRARRRLPGIDGFEVCRRLRDVSDGRVLMLTAQRARSTRCAASRRRRRLPHQAVHANRVAARVEARAAPREAPPTTPSRAGRARGPAAAPAHIERSGRAGSAKKSTLLRGSSGAQARVERVRRRSWSGSGTRTGGGQRRRSTPTSAGCRRKLGDPALDHHGARRRLRLRALSGAPPAAELDGDALVRC